MSVQIDRLTIPEPADAAMLLDPAPMALEMGVQVLPSGQTHVAARTDMAACTGAMFEWWFRFAPDTQQYAWWHPIDHVSSRWVERNPLTHVGSTHLVEERLGGAEVYELNINFVEASELFGADAVEDARESGDVSALVVARIGLGFDIARDEQGRPQGGWLAHIGRDTPHGLVLRSRFWLPDGPPPQLGLGLMQHAATEFKYLARFLPSLYIAENRDSEAVELPW
jgi:hypothetical protein